jgi:electron transfer flavoprotein beta subunit
MKILVACKAVPDPDAASSTTETKWIINPFDAIALEEALQIKERGAASEVVAVSIGPPRVDEQLRAALAMGADRVVRIEEARPIDSYFVAKVLQAFVARESPDLIVMGKQAIDDDSNQVGQMLAGLLARPQATFVSQIELTDGGRRARCTRETDSGLQVIEVSLPAVITTDLRLNEPRYVSLPGLIKAQRKPIETLTCDDLRVNAQPHTATIRMDSTPSRHAGTRVHSVEELVTKLRDEAKAI